MVGYINNIISYIVRAYDSAEFFSDRCYVTECVYDDDDFNPET